MKTAVNQISRVWLAFLPLLLATLVNAQTAAVDNATCPMNNSVVIDVRANDTWGPAYNTVSYTFFPGPYNGTITILNSDSILYTPNTNYNGPDDFIYGIEDPNNPGYAIDTAHVYVNVVGNCWNIFTYNHNTFACGDSMLFVGTASGSNIIYTWDMGDGNIYSDTSLSTILHVYTAGVYTVTLTTVDNLGCTYITSSTFSVTGGISVDAGNDTAFCQQPVQLMATTQPSGSFIYSWSPANLLQNPNSQNPYGYPGSHLHNQPFVVTVTDTATGCTATDTVLASSYNPITGPFYLCAGDTLTLDFGPGGTSYNWQTFYDTTGTPYAINQTTQTLVVTQPGDYLGYAFFPGCGPLTSYVQVIDSCMSTNCSNIITYMQQPGQCGDMITFVGSASNNTVSWTWDMGNGHVYSGPTMSVANDFYTYGSYTITLTTVDNLNCTAVSTITVNVTNGITANAGPDIVTCQQLAQLNVAVNPSSSNLTYYWSGNNTISDPYIQNPTVSHADSALIIVSVTDTVTGCTSSDSLYVTAYNPVVDTFYICNNSTVVLDFGPGASNYYWQYYTDTAGNMTSLTATTQFYLASQPGTYMGYAIFPGCGALTSLFYVVDTCMTQSCSVNAGPDTTFCQQQGQLNAVASPAGNYTFSWSPANGLDDPNIQNPNVISGVSSQQYVVTMTDTATGCTSTDTVIVSAYYFFNDTVYICDSSNVTLDLGPGASSYYWQYFTDTAGNTSFINIYTQTLTVNQPGQYVAIAIFPGCGALTSVFHVIDSCNVYVSDVWPGDCNYDLVANMADALHIGLGYGATDAIRPNATPLWYPQPMTDWAQNFTNCNYKHADADGDGVINVNDTLPISLNYGNTHPFRLGQPEFIASAPTLTLIANYDTVGLQTLVTIDVQLGSAALPVDSLYGISFRITADAGLIDTTLTAINLNNTWLGTMGGNMFGFRKAFPGGGRIDAAESRNDHQNRLNGSGTIATFSIVTTDNLSGIAICHIDVTEVTAVTASQHYLAINVVNDSVVINSAMPAGIEAPGAETGFSAYPNPANEQVTVQTGKTASRIEICDMLGRTVQSVSPASATTVLNTSTLADGVYLIRVYSGSSVTTQKLTVTR